MPKFHVNVNFWPVGQGLFSSGYIKDTSVKSRKGEFRWVYDCGSTSKQNVNKAIKLYDESIAIKDSFIDLVAISHFHEDHISGLARLL